MRVTNSTKDPIFLESRTLGLTVRRDIGGQFYGFDDQSCECRMCARACDSTCSCPDAGVSRIFKLQAGGTSTRDWNGVVLVSGVSTCSSAGMCLDPENAPLNEPFSLELCFSNQRPTGVQFDDAGVGPGELPALSKTCVTKSFMIQDGVVEIGPARGAACTTTADCKGQDELCFDGACTAGCPANEYPELGSNWDLIVASPDNMGFFTQMPRPPSGKQFSGTGTITSVVYVGSSLQVSLTRPGLPNEQLTGKVTVQLPPMVGAPLQVGASVTVTVVDDGDKTPTRALVIRDSTKNTVLFAADMAQGGALLGAADLTPFSTATTEVPVGCRQNNCGRLLFFDRTWTWGASSVRAEPGKKVSLPLADGTWSFLNVTNGAYKTTRCEVTSIQPWVMWREL